MVAIRVKVSLKIFEIAEFELNLSESPLNKPSWIENFQISGADSKSVTPKTSKNRRLPA